MIILMLRHLKEIMLVETIATVAIVTIPILMLSAHVELGTCRASLVFLITNIHLY